METPYHRRIFWSKKAGRGRIWTQHKVAGVLNSFKGETSIAQICQERWIAQARRFPRKPEKEARVTIARLLPKTIRRGSRRSQSISGIRIKDPPCPTSPPRKP